MKKINNKNDILTNMKMLDAYIDNKFEPEYSYAIERIRNGVCFIAIKSDDITYRFYPSRFMGYKDNTMSMHESNNTKDGGKTNEYIRSIMGCKEEANQVMEDKYLEYCNMLGISPTNKKRKYWLFSL